jgi:tetratricopeptide (TPR) repeat protein
MKKLIYILPLILLTNTLLGQPQITFEAFQYYQEKNLIKAKELIERAVLEKEGQKDPLSWHIKGFVYKDLYNKEEEKLASSNLREVALEALKKSKEFDQKGEYKENNDKALRHLAISYYNDAAIIMRELDTTNLVMSDSLYSKYKTIYSETDKAYDFKEKDISYYKAIATCYRKLYEENRMRNKKYFNRAIICYKKVIGLDPENYSANYNIAVNLYNEGAFKIEQIDAEDQIPTIVKIQSSSIELFKQALPYMLKAYSLNPEREETLKGLRGIYLSLSEDEEANKYKALLINKQEAGNK